MDTNEALDIRLSRLGEKVEAKGARVVSESMLWCTVCCEQVPLHQPCSVQRWEVHVDQRGHKMADALQVGIINATVAAQPVFMSNEWLDMRKATWRTLMQNKRANRAHEHD